MNRYAAKTEVPVEKTRAEIEGTVRRYALCDQSFSLDGCTSPVETKTNFVKAFHYKSISTITRATLSLSLTVQNKHRTFAPANGSKVFEYVFKEDYQTIALYSPGEGLPMLRCSHFGGAHSAAPSLLKEVDDRAIGIRQRHDASGSSLAASAGDGDSTFPFKHPSCPGKIYIGPSRSICEPSSLTLLPKLPTFFSVSGIAASGACTSFRLVLVGHVIIIAPLPLGCDRRRHREKHGWPS